MHTTNDMNYPRTDVCPLIANIIIYNCLQPASPVVGVSDPRQTVVVVILQYLWQIDVLKHGFVSLSQAKCGCTFNHLYFVRLPVVDIFLGATRAPPRL